MRRTIGAALAVAILAVPAAAASRPPLPANHDLWLKVGRCEQPGNGYGFDDTRVRLYGGWQTAAQRDGQLKKYAAANPDQWTQAVRIETSSPYAFRAGPAGTYSHWSFGPWLHETGKAVRDDEMKAYEASNNTTARPWRKTYKEA